MDPLLLSQHSSNPLEAPSDDSRNKRYVRQYRRASQRVRLARDAQESSSEDAPDAPEVEQYQVHIAQLYQGQPPSQSKPKPDTGMQASTSKRVVPPVPPGFVDLDEDMSDDSGEDVPLDLQPSRTGLRGRERYADDTLVNEEEHDDDREDTVEDGLPYDDKSEEHEDDIVEELSIYLKPKDERAEILEEIEELSSRVPELTSDYKLIDRLGTGTFSSVYKAIDLHHSQWFNAPWKGTRPRGSPAPTPAPEQGKMGRRPKVFVAVKRIYVTSGPERVRNELSILADCRGCRHVSQLITAFRQQDQVVAIMPYHRNEDFRDFFRVLPLEGMKAYFRCMFRALRDVHTRGIIHRDVKPANFLFDPRTGEGTLCDFGLACRIEKGLTAGQCLHTPSTIKHPHGQSVGLRTSEVEMVRKLQREARTRSSWPSEKVGYLDKDTRPHSKANRAGTRGFRAPEVLLKCGDQSGAIDVWSAGMIMLFFLTGKFPLMNASDDVEALVEIAAIIGRKKMEQTAALHSRTFQSNIPSITLEGVSWRAFVERLNPDLRTPRPPDGRFYPYCLDPSFSRTHSRSQSQQTHRSASLPPPTSSQERSRPLIPGSASKTYDEEIDDVLDLLEGLMHPESTHRSTPSEALAHPFLREDTPVPEEFKDDPDAALAPQQPELEHSTAVCAQWHFLDEVGEHCVQIRADDGRFEVRRLEAGQGVCYGNQPCEFHREGYLDE